MIWSVLRIITAAVVLRIGAEVLGIELDSFEKVMGAFLLLGGALALSIEVETMFSPVALLQRQLEYMQQLAEGVAVALEARGLYLWRDPETGVIEIHEEEKLDV